MVKKKTTGKKTTKKVSKKTVKKKTEEIIPEVITEKKVVKKTKKKKQNPLKQKNVLIVAALIIILIISLIISTTMLTSPCGFSRFSFSINGLSYCSNQFVPTVFFEEFKELDEVYVAITLVENDYDPLEVNALLLWQVALNSEQKKSIQLVKAIDKQGNLLYCSTNEGDVKIETKLSKEECQILLNDSNKFFVLIENGPEKVILEENKLIIYSSTYKVISQINFEVIKQIFPDAEKNRLIANEKIYGIN